MVLQRVTLAKSSAKITMVFGYPSWVNGHTSHIPRVESVSDFGTGVNCDIPQRHSLGFRKPCCFGLLAIGCF